MPAAGSLGRSQGAEAHFFLIDPVRFVRGERDTQLSSEDCGTTQHYLLLDEFYRTAIWLAGRTPIWWLVPVYEEAGYDRYTHTLISKRFIRADETLDLGHLATFRPANSSAPACGNCSRASSRPTSRCSSCC
jgi:adenylate cyclase class 1